MHSQAGIWKVINHRNSAASPPLQLDIDGTNISNEQEVCEAFGEHFREKVNRLKKNSNASEIFKKLRDAYPSVPSWDLSHCTEEQVEKYIKNLKNTMSTGPDQISNRLLKATSDFILSPLTKIINLSIDSGIFPKIWKETKISPIHKSGSKTSITNYRPIALTSTLGKVLEGMIHKQYHPQLDALLPSNMFGFRPNRSTQDAITSVLERVKLLKNDGKKIALLSVDATAAFDLLSHELVLGSLQILGFGPRMIAWVKSFFEGCSQHVQIGSSKSSSWTTDVGVGQGRKPSPDLFNIGYLTQCIWSIISEFFGYADDGMDVIAGDSLAECNVKVQQVASLRAAWFDAAGIPINTAKTELMGIGFRPDPININGSQINPSTSIKFLGCIIQSDLKFDEHSCTVHIFPQFVISLNRRICLNKSGLWNSIS